jgi:hypothetical protein
MDISRTHVIRSGTMIRRSSTTARPLLLPVGPVGCEGHQISNPLQSTKYLISIWRLQKSWVTGWGTDHAPPSFAV